MCGCAGCCCWGSTMELSTDKFMMMLCVEDVMLCIELRSCAVSRLQHGVWSTCVQGERWSLTEHWPGPGRGQGPVSHGGAGTQPGTGGRGSVSPRSDTTLFSGAAAPSSEQLPGSVRRPGGAAPGSRAATRRLGRAAGHRRTHGLTLHWAHWAAGDTFAFYPT